jgi:hypothetical protein
MKDNFFDIYDRIENQRTVYLRELGGLSKIFITISSALLGLTLAPLGPNAFTRTGISWLVLTWITLGFSSALGFLHIFFFAVRFKSQAERLRASQLADVSFRLNGPEQRAEELSEQSNRYQRRFERQSKLCVASLVAQALALFTSFGFLAEFVCINLKS